MRRAKGGVGTRLLAVAIAVAVAVAFSSLTPLARRCHAANADTGSDIPCLGLVVGATDADALRRARAAAPNLWLLSPGVGAQGGDLDAACAAGLTKAGSGMLIPVSRGISRAEDHGEAAKGLRDNINAARAKVVAASGEDSNAIEGFQTEFIEFALAQGVLKFGDSRLGNGFTLKSGRESPYFFNAGLFDSGAALFKLGKAYAASIMKSELAVGRSEVKVRRVGVMGYANP